MADNFASHGVTYVFSVVIGGLETTDFVMNNSFWVGVYPGMTDAMVDYMAEVIKEAVNGKRR